MLLSAFSILGLTLGAVGCSWTSAGGITARYESKDETSAESAEGSWGDEPLAISSHGGSVQVVGVPGKTNITVHARFVAGANDRADAEAAFADVAESLTIEKRDGSWRIDCPTAKSWHGSVDPESTGCSSLRIEVPSGTASAPLQVSVVAGFGGIHASRLVVKKLDAQAPFGIVADVTPVSDAEIRLWGDDLVTGMCSSVLRVPAESTLGEVSLTVANPQIEYVGVAKGDPRYWLGASIDGFPDGPSVPPRSGAFSWSRGDAPFAAKRIEIHASLGKAILTTSPVADYRAFNQCENAELRIATSS